MIFVAVAVAWAIYLIPKAIRHHEEVSGSRSVEKFSDTLRVLARREPVNERDARLVVPTAKPEVVEPPTPAQLRARREATRRATARRRRVFLVLLATNLLVALAATTGLVGWSWQALPAGLLVVWLVLCRVMVKSERATTQQMVAPVLPAEEATTEAVEVPADYDVARNEQGFDEVGPEAETSTIPAVTAELWDPMPVTLPTYVGKDKALRRSVRTIDLGAPDTWTSGRTEESAELAREADAAAATAREAEQPAQRAVGS